MALNFLVVVLVLSCLAYLVAFASFVRQREKQHRVRMATLSGIKNDGMPPEVISGPFVKNAGDRLLCEVRRNKQLVGELTNLIKGRRDGR